MTQRIPPRALVLLPILWLVWGTNWPLFPLATREVSVWTFRAVSVFVGKPGGQKKGAGRPAP